MYLRDTSLERIFTYYFSAILRSSYLTVYKANSSLEFGIWMLKWIHICTIVINRLSKSFFLSRQMGEYHSSRTQGWLIQWRFMVDITLFIFNWHMRFYLTVVRMSTGYLLFLYRITIPAVSGWTFDRVTKLSL